MFSQDSSTFETLRQHRWNILPLGLCLLASLLTALVAVPAEAQLGALCPDATHSGADYSGQDLQDRNFSNQDLAGANFTGADLQGATFAGADLQGADFTAANLGLSPSNQRPASFSRANLDGACFNQSLMVRTDFQFASLNCSVFASTDLTTVIFGPVIKAAAPGGECRTTFTGSVLGCEFVPQWKDLNLNRATVQGCADDLQGADLSGGWLQGVVFSGVDLQDTRFDGADLKGAFFLGAKLHRTVFTGADLRRAQLSRADASEALFDGQARLSGAHLSGIKLQGADLTNAVLQAADGLPAADLSLAYMPDAVLTDAKLTGVNLSHSSFYGTLARADNATMEQVDLSNANLGSVDLTQGRLAGAKLDAANLANAVLVGADLQPTTGGVAASLVSANLQGTDFSGAKLGSANLSNAAVALEDGVSLFPAPSGLAADLDRRWLTAEVADAFTQAGQGLLPCSNPQVQVDRLGREWQIWLTSAVGPTGARYKKFLLELTSGAIAVSGISSVTAPEALFDLTSAYAGSLDDQLLASGLLQDFEDESYSLPPCTNPYVRVLVEGSRWEIKETLTSATVAGLGYTGYRLVGGASEIRVYGSEITVVRPDGTGSLTIAPLPVRPTGLTASALSDSTTCPNQQSYGANVASGVSWEDMMTAVQPPSPPSCIPSPTTWCPNV
ncbi:MAG: pentapeptide repeat-containing protein [Acidobacteriota bacterium]|nr:pentapeptide repeat-containing protein [Acidobacteriota bacterium]